MKMEKDNITIQIFHFNFIMVNTLVIFDKSKEAMIVDPGNCNQKENEMLTEFIERENLTVKYIVNTHPHIDHVVGNDFCVKTFNAPLLASQSGMSIYKDSASYGSTYGFTQKEYPTPNQWINDGEMLALGNQKWQIINCFGHADGSICLYNNVDQLLIAGDVLFEGSIGRTDLPTGDYDMLINNIKTRLLTLPENTIVIPGHGDTTTIREEKQSNPYLR